MVAGARAGLYVPAHVQLHLLAADAPGRRHDRVAHAVAARAVHPRLRVLLEVAAARVLVAEPRAAARVRDVADPRLGPRLIALLLLLLLVLEAQPGLGALVRPGLQALLE